MLQQERGFHKVGGKKPKCANPPVKPISSHSVYALVYHSQPRQLHSKPKPCLMDADWASHPLHGLMDIGRWRRRRGRRVVRTRSRRIRRRGRRGRRVLIGVRLLVGGRLISRRGCGSGGDRGRSRRSSSRNRLNLILLLVGSGSTASQHGLALTAVAVDTESQEDEGDNEGDPM
jgi:hypothetical protein